MNGQQDKFKGESIILTIDTEHKPVPDEDAEIMLFEPGSTINTGNLQNEFIK